MTMSSIPDNIDKDIFLELHAVIDCELDHLVNTFWLIGVNMNYRTLSAFCDIAGIEA